jgi:DNA adenine methylase
MPAVPVVASVPSPLRWAGGKRWLRPVIADLIRDVTIARYHEPFLGGGSVFLGLPPFAKAYLRDTNRELIDSFRVIRDEPEALATRIAHFENDKVTYYRVRSSVPEEKLDRAARFVYLNHTSYNGIYRVNLAGVYNVPFGDRRAPQLPTAEHLGGVSDRLKKALSAWMWSVSPDSERV